MKGIIIFLRGAVAGVALLLLIPVVIHAAELLDWLLAAILACILIGMTAGAITDSAEADKNLDKQS